VHFGHRHLARTPVGHGIGLRGRARDHLE
jgi:hypothetical protein